MKKGKSIKLKIAIVISIIVTLFWLIPYIYVICCSFKPGSEVIAVPPSFLPKVFSTESFSQLFSRMDAAKYLINSLTTAVGSTLIAVILGSLAAYAIQRSGAKLSVWLVVLILCLKMIPTSSIAVPIYYATGSKKKAIKMTFLSGIAEPLGALLACTFLRNYISSELIGFILLFVGGIMITLAIEELLPKAISYHQEKYLIFGGIIGIIILLINHFLL